MSALPITASSPDFSLVLGIGIVAELLVGINVLGGHGSAGAGMFINMPHLDLTVSQLRGANADCELVTSNTPSGFLSNVFPNLTHVVPTAGIDVGLQAQAKIDFAEWEPSFTTDHTLAGTSFPLPTKCLMWDENSNAFTTPTTTSTSTAATATGSGSPNKKTNMGARGTHNPISELSSMGWMLGLLLSVLFIAVTL